ncbi:hypothetical protein GALMADRAFT_592095 [Galerina marginata CBS 339.88]|uniref:Uncharacterized protein n=1 Tax=Galerina marginata (strain CBS 339.88) TaxID=685588 RepID=A0A067SSG1_GALM3|nr:hypothetical protein GALMADRAFT_592095 [Galerina marginata CBS 339.88]
MCVVIPSTSQKPYPLDRVIRWCRTRFAGFNILVYCRWAGGFASRVGGWTGKRIGMPPDFQLARRWV